MFVYISGRSYSRFVQMYQFFAQLDVDYIQKIFVFAVVTNLHCKLLVYNVKSRNLKKLLDRHLSMFKIYPF